MGKRTPLRQLTNRTAGRRMEMFVKQGRFQEALDLVDECERLAPGERHHYPQVMADYMSYAEVPPAHRAGMAEHGPVIVRKLHAMGVDPNRMTFAGSVPWLMQAVMADNLPVARTLLELGADPNKLSTQNDSTILMEMNQDNPELAQALIQHGANPVAEGNWGTPTLWQLAGKGLPRVMQVVMDAGADIGYLDQYNQSILHHLAREMNQNIVPGHRDAVLLAVVSGVDPHREDTQGITPMAAARVGKPQDTLAAWVQEGLAILHAQTLDEHTRNALPARQRARL